MVALLPSLDARDPAVPSAAHAHHYSLGAPAPAVVDLVPALHQYLHHARHVQVVLLARATVAPAPPLPPAAVAFGARLLVEVEPHPSAAAASAGGSGFDDGGQGGAARVEVEAAGVAVEDESSDVALAGVAEAWAVARRPRQKLESALRVEWVAERRHRRLRTLPVEVVVADAALEAGSDAHFLAAVALERHLCVLKPQLVLWVAGVSDLPILHLYLRFLQINALIVAKRPWIGRYVHRNSEAWRFRPRLQF